MSNTKDHKDKSSKFYGKKKRPVFDKPALLEMIAKNNTDDQVYTKIHAAELFALLTLSGFDLEINPDAGEDALYLSHAGDSFGVLLSSIGDNSQYEGDFAISLQVRIAHHNMTFESCNTWNSRWLFGVCYINPELELVVKSDLLLEGGVTGIAIGRFVVEYLDLFDDLMKFDDALEL